MFGTNGPILPSSGTVQPAAWPKGYDRDSTIELRPIWCQMRCPAHRYMLGILSSTAVPFKKSPLRCQASPSIAVCRPASAMLLQPQKETSNTEGETDFLLPILCLFVARDRSHDAGNNCYSSAIFTLRYSHFISTPPWICRPSGAAPEKLGSVYSEAFSLLIQQVNVSPFA